MGLMEQCREIAAVFEKIEVSLADPDLMGDAVRYREATKRHRDLGKIVTKWREYERALTARANTEGMTNDPDPEIAAMANAELEELALRLPEIERELTLLLLPNDPLDEKNIVMEIRAGTGGDEAALFAGDLFRMYSRYAERLGWKLEILSSNAPDMGGFKEVIFSISGERVYSRLKFESGTHRVQRVPTTEAQGRIHTSAITVAVLPEADEVDMVVKPEEVRVDVYRSSGHGGQSVNTTDSAVRITHLPTGMIVTCQDEKSQLKNRVKAMKVLRSRLLDLEIQKRQDVESAQRREQVGSGDRSGRIRTYNYPQNRVTDHRIGLTLYHLQRVLEGDLDDVVGALVADEQKRRLERAGGL